MIDIHSDTVTQPTQKMREAMMYAEVGDDVSEEDPTVKELETRTAKLFQKEAALFFPSGTMSNLTALLAWCPERGSEVIMGDNSHMFLYEQGGAGQYGGITTRTVPNLEDGTMKISTILDAIRENDIHEPITKLICIENTHNACGGKILPIEFLEELHNQTMKKQIPIHMDGARIWNALTRNKREPSEISKYVDSLSVCLSKGLGCPVGSLLIGSHDFIKKARRIRKGLGGGMRQVGILAAAGLVGLDDFTAGILEEDHRRTQQIADAIATMPLFKLMTPTVETTILFLETQPPFAQTIQSLLKLRGVLVGVWTQTRIRLVLHRDIDDTMTQYIIRVLRELSHDLHPTATPQL
jgi:threonine aldolase